MKIIVKLYTLLWLLLYVLMPAQNKNPDIDGVYNKGGVSFIIKKDNTFLIVAMGTLIKGNWSVDKNIITLTPKNPDALFYLYARKNPDIKEGMRLMISANEYNNDIYVGVFPNKMKRFFNKEANCFDYPYVHQSKELPEILTFIDQTKSEDPYQAEVPNAMQQFSTAGYNDFIVQYMNPALFHNPFQFEIKKEGLKALANTEDSGIIKKQNIKEFFKNEKELSFLEQSFNMAYQAAYKLVNYAYNTNDDMSAEIDLSHYKYDKTRNVYVNLSIPDKSLNYKSDDFHYTDVLMKFDRITSDNKKVSDFKPLSGSVFVAECK
ncbi:hypothetical protein KRE47_04010 [Elizabethkingia meningoseptica]|uniref:Uncharacterized protein n=1 Tax=Elizabethkingia meningoseptica TaxID=238 RepID=A0A1T3F870_ELIME|nr:MULTISPECIES: hypothetical protein [Elizabethkingia]AQX14068.1 hypothetical protein BBD35_17590 [Elizabethkingia meningoseptica]EJK5327994.1 hypothetical protein [Elizabethkingia meningoseptica]MBG0515893.1 hypothetical protein [Elizabethkingia meningoseptica]MDE5430183.1 hypothetical protein [Elizabethkingia meningoseptica]MDE5435853.1 hypothetical protein [Elizabethkingia meningoseptica]